MPCPLQKGHRTLKGPAALQVFTTCGSRAKREALLGMFPELQEDHIGNSRDTSFERLVRTLTDGAGVDIVLNSLAGDKLQVGSRNPLVLLDTPTVMRTIPKQKTVAPTPLRVTWLCWSTTHVTVQWCSALTVQASVHCLGRFGRLLEIGKFDMANRSSLPMHNMLKGVSYESIVLDQLWSAPDTTQQVQLSKP